MQFLIGIGLPYIRDIKMEKYIVIIFSSLSEILPYTI